MWGFRGRGGGRTHSKSGQDVGAGTDTDSNEALQTASKHAGRLLAASCQQGEKKQRSESKDLGSLEVLEHQRQGLRQLVHGRVLEPAEAKALLQKMKRMKPRVKE